MIDLPLAAPVGPGPFIGEQGQWVPGSQTLQGVFVESAEGGGPGSESGLNRNDHGAALQPKEIALKVPLSGTFRVVPCGEAFSEQTTTFRSFKTVSYRGKKIRAEHIQSRSSNDFRSIPQKQQAAAGHYGHRAQRAT